MGIFCMSNINMVFILYSFLIYFCPGYSFCQNIEVKYYDQGVLHAINGEYEQGKTALEKAIGIDSLYYYAKEALRVIEKVQFKKISNKTAYNFFKGVRYGNEGVIDSAITAITKSIYLNPNFEEAFNNRGQLYVWQNEFDKAIRDFSRSIEIDPKFSSPYSNRGNAYSKKGLYDQAIADYRFALKLNPKDYFTYNNLAITYYYKKDYKKAIQNVQKVHDLGGTVSQKLIDALNRTTK